MNRLAIVSMCFLVGACGQAVDQAKRTAAGIKGDDKHTPANNPVCKMFSQAEAARYVGLPVDPPENAMGGCQWARGDGSGSMLVAVVPARYHERPTLGKGFRNVTDIGTKGFVVPSMGGYDAGAIAGKEAVRVRLSGKGVTEERTLELLKEAIQRHK